MKHQTTKPQLKYNSKNSLVVLWYHIRKLFRVERVDRIQVIDQPTTRVRARVSNKPLNLAVILHEDVSGDGEVHLFINLRVRISMKMSYRVVFQRPCIVFLSQPTSGDKGAINESVLIGCSVGRPAMEAGGKHEKGIAFPQRRLDGGCLRWRALPLIVSPVHYLGQHMYLSIII